MTKIDLVEKLNELYNLAEVYVAIDVPSANGLYTNVFHRPLLAVLSGEKSVTLLAAPPEPEHFGVCVETDANGRVTRIGKKP